MARGKRRWWLSWRRWSPTTRRLLLLLLVGIGLLIASLAATEPLLRAFGWGMAPTLLSILLLWGVILFRPSWLKRYLRYWLGGLGLLFSFMGALAFVQLGGRLGQTLIGPEGHLALLRALRLVLLVVASVALLHPKGTWVAVRWLVAEAKKGLSKGREWWDLRRIQGKVQAQPEPHVEVVLPPEPAVSKEVHNVLESPPRLRVGPLEAGTAPPSRPRLVSKPPPTPIVTPMSRRQEGWHLPSTAILRAVREAKADTYEGQRRARELEKALADFGIEVEVEDFKSGPTVTQYWLRPGWVRRFREVKERDASGRPRLDRVGNPIVKRIDESTRVKVDSILALEKDLALALAAPTIRIEAPIPGQSAMGVEVPNRSPGVVGLRSVVESPEFQALRAKTKLPIALGKGMGGESVVLDLAEMPHLLVAGATGSGKSVCINAVLCSLLLSATPAELRLMLVDPKRVEFTPYNGIPHLLTDIITEADRVVKALRWVTQEMGERYKRMQELQVRNIAGYNEQVPSAERMPYLVVAIDELADIMMLTAADAEQALCRLAQLGRATGIHLVVATQRPSVDVVTGLIKANFPSRISFAVASQVDSRTILDSVGAEKLLGKGDMLYLPSDAPKPRRIQGVMVADDEIRRLTAFWKGQKGPSSPTIPLEEMIQAMSQEEGKDELLGKARELAQSHSRVSTSFLQRRLGIGYNRAARLMELLEEEGTVTRRGEDASEASAEERL